MELRISIPKEKKIVKIKVNNKSRLDLILKIICKNLNLGKEESWSFVWQGEDLNSRFESSITIDKIGIKDGGELELIKRARIEKYISKASEEDIDISESQHDSIQENMEILRARFLVGEIDKKIYESEKKKLEQELKSIS